MGTPEIAVPCLRATAAWADEVRVVTQPDRPRGRSGTPQPPPVKVAASELGLEVVQPERIRDEPEFLPWLSAAPTDVIVVVAFGQILPAEVLDHPQHGCLNVHFSLLPKYRGAAPVQWALIEGEQETGVCTMLMDEGLDTGDILLCRTVAIEAEEHAGALLDRLAALAPEVLRESLEEWCAGRLTRTPQDEARATKAPRLRREDGRLDWAQPADRIVARVRGVTPWPGATAEVAGETVKVLRAAVGDGAGAPGEVLDLADDKGLLIAAGRDAVWLREVQEPGRKAVGGAAYARGKRLTAGSGRQKES